MNVASIALDKVQARELYRKYKTHQHYETDLDREVKRTYQLIAQGKVIIQAIEAIKLAGLDAKGLPKLALANATAAACVIRRFRNGSMRMASEHPSARLGGWPKERPVVTYHDETFVFDRDTFPIVQREGGKVWRASLTDHRSATPVIPIHLRPKRGLQNYHILWEAQWEPVPTLDPYLLRRIGKADLWLVCAAWDLTDVERAAMATRIMAR